MRLIKLPRHAQDDGMVGFPWEVIVIEGMPFIIKRMFILAAKDGAERGKHAHRQCTQLIVCVNGKVDINCKNGFCVSETFTLSSRDVALMVDPMVWVTIRFWDNAIVSVLCDRVYEEKDYIRDYDEYLDTYAGDA